MLAQPRACLIEMVGEGQATNETARLAAHDASTQGRAPNQAHTSPGNDSAKRGRLRRDGRRMGIQASEWTCTCATHSRHMAALYNVGFTK